jgi:hypothetical protein
MKYFELFSRFIYEGVIEWWVKIRCFDIILIEEAI